MGSNGRIYLSSPHMSDEGYEMKYIREAFDTNWVAPVGRNIDEFEREFAVRTGAGSVAALSSGTAAMHMALRAAGVGNGDTVFCSSLTFCGSTNPVLYQNAIPIFIDSDNKTWNMDPDMLENAFMTHSPKAVVVTHIYGLSADMDRIVKISRKHGAAVIEDAAESLGTLYKGRQTGTIGDYGVFSFNGNKIITTSGGGMLVSGSEERISKVRFWATQARDNTRYYQHSELGFNYRMSNISAGIGRGQLRVLDKRVKRKREIFRFYREELGGLDGVEMMPVNSWERSNCWLSCILLKDRIRPLDIIEALGAENIESRPVWKPMHMQPLYSGCEFAGSGVSEKLFENGVCLPSDTKMTERDLDRVAGVIKRLWK